ARPVGRAGRRPGDDGGRAQHAQLRPAAHARRGGRLTMGTPQRHVAGGHKGIEPGGDAHPYNIRILRRRSRTPEPNKFATDVNGFIKTSRTTAPYDKLWGGINVHRIDVASTDSGADDPGSCGDGSFGTGVKARTYFDATFCGDGRIRRLLTCKSSLAR